MLRTTRGQNVRALVPSHAAVAAEWPAATVAIVQRYLACLWPLLATALAVCVPKAAFGTSVVTPDFATLVARADLIFTGAVTAQHSEWRRINGERSIVTLVSFDVAAVHKGRAGKSITLQFLGGAIGDVTFDVAAMPKFQPGERVVLFVEKNGENISPLIGVYHGRFSLRKDSATGRDIVFKHDGQPLFAVAELGEHRVASKTLRTTQNGETSKPMSHDDLITKVREQLTRSNR